MSLNKKRILNLIEENYVFAFVLHHFGIDYYDYQEQGFAEICIKKDLNPELVVASLEDVIEDDHEHLQYLRGLPVDLVITYLKHKHFFFIRQTLPYLSKLVNSYPTNKEFSVINEIGLNLPLFIEDYIIHMHKEESVTFNHILTIDQALKGNIIFSKVFFDLRNKSIIDMAQDHELQDDIMLGIREITNNYSLEKYSPVLLKVIYSELQSFEKHLIIHSRIENGVLFPKALVLEKELYKTISKYAVFN